MMAIKDLYVHIDNDKVCGKRLTAAVDLATRMDAHLTGVYVRRAFPFPAYSTVPMSADVMETYDNLLDEKESKARNTFSQYTGAQNARVSWRALSGSVTGVLADEARYSDLLILGQPDPDDSESLNQGLADQVVFTAGRPCLLIPYTGNATGFGQSPLIAWDGSRESARAIHDAMPLLNMAGKATLLIVQPEKADTDFADLPGALISEHLARHDIAVEVEVLRGGVQGTGDAILSYVDAYGYDLVVMGAYGHSRWREIVLGGVTRRVMANMKVPVFMSH
ncbi:MAG: universal stress protein [Thiolinea sp.]